MPLPPLVETGWLAQHLSAPDLTILDASWYLPAEGRDARAEYAETHIPGALFFDIDAVADAESALPHMLPSAESFGQAMSALGLCDGQRIVVYDGAGIYSAPRAWWSFRAMGVREVAVLNGGLPRWRAEGRPLDSGTVRPGQGGLKAHLDPSLVRDLQGIARDLESGGTQVVDARSPARFRGETPEPRAGLRSGHIPGSRNLHYAALIDADGRMRPPAEVTQAFEAAGVDLARPIVTSCGSGITAAILSLALATIGRPDVGLYDGSWTDWGSRADVPVAAGAP